MRTKIGNHQIPNLLSIILAVVLVTGALTIVIPSAITEAFAAGNGNGQSNNQNNNSTNNSQNENSNNNSQNNEQPNSSNEQSNPSNEQSESGNNGSEDNEHKTTICHFPQGDPENPVTILVADSSVPAHIEQHGDYLGECVINQEDEQTNSDNEQSNSDENTQSESQSDNESNSQNNESENEQSDSQSDEQSNSENNDQSNSENDSNVPSEESITLTGTAISQTIINIEWNEISPDCGEVTGYDIYRMGPEDEGFVLIDSVAANTTQYTDSGLDGNTTYTYKVVAICSGECPSIESDQASATTMSFAVPHGALSYDITPPVTNGIDFHSTFSEIEYDGFFGRLASYSNDIPTQIMYTGAEERVQVSVYDNNGIAAIKRVVVNMFFDYMETQKADTYFMYEEEGQKLTVSDPFGFFGDVSVHRTFTASDMILTFVFTPQNPMPITDLVINAEDEYRNNQNTIVFGAFEIQGESMSSEQSSTALAVIPYYKNSELNQIVIDSDGNMMIHDSFGNLDKVDVLVNDEFVQYGSYIGRSERHDDGFYDKVLAEEVKAKEVVDSMVPTILAEPDLIKTDKVFNYPSNVGKSDREDIKAMSDLKQKEHLKAMVLVAKIS